MCYRRAKLWIDMPRAHAHNKRLVKKRMMTSPYMRDQFISAKRITSTGKILKPGTCLLKARRLVEFTNIRLSYHRENLHKPRCLMKGVPRISFTPLKMISF